MLVSLVAAPVMLRPATARADGDPASDVLLTQDIFFPYSTPVARSLTSLLTATVRRAHAAGFPIKVALIEGPQDLGAVPRLFGTPQRYAKFLDLEISYNSEAKLLVVMPQGIGIAGVRSSPSVAAIHVDATKHSDGLARAAIAAVAVLARSEGHPIAAPALPDADTTSGSSQWPFVAVAVGLIVLVGTGVAARLRRSRAPGVATGGKSDSDV